MAIVIVSKAQIDQLHATMRHAKALCALESAKKEIIRTVRAEGVNENRVNNIRRRLDRVADALNGRGLARPTHPEPTR
jgi:hypothetical protein